MLLKHLPTPEVVDTYNKVEKKVQVCNTNEEIWLLYFSCLALVMLSCLVFDLQNRH